jgi:hypothetical protein
LTVSVWQVPFYREAGWNGVVQTWFNPASARINAGLVAQLGHMATFPAAVVGASLPWSPHLAALLFKPFWKLEGPVRSAVVFLLCGSAAIAGPVWISPGGNPRYVMPMYPLLAALCGAVVHQCLKPELAGPLRRFWRDYVRILAVLVAVATIVFVAITLSARFAQTEWVHRLVQPGWQIALLAPLFISGAIALIRRAPSNRPRDAMLVSFLVGALPALCFNGPVLNTLARSAVDIRPDVAALHRRIPEGSRLVSIGRAHHRLLYYYPEPIPLVRRPWSAEDVPADLEYFVIEAHRGETTALPFEWEEIGRLNMDRTKSDDPEDLAVIGRRALRAK